MVDACRREASGASRLAFQLGLGAKGRETAPAVHGDIFWPKRADDFTIVATRTETRRALEKIDMDKKFKTKSEFDAKSLTDNDISSQRRLSRLEQRWHALPGGRRDAERTVASGMQGLFQLRQPVPSFSQIDFVERDQRRPLRQLWVV